MHRREAPRLSRRRRIAALGLGGLLALAVIGLTQCRMVDDRITGVDLRSPAALDGPSGCVLHCVEIFKTCWSEEWKLHHANIVDCNQIESEDEREECKRAEEERHAQAIERCVAERKACKAACYNEGAGSLGS